ncbi:MAG: alpha-L-fucosidase [Candidatus Omnitrophica bacterium]|nr:alpha-L-fucosidase [Candidatus Omnitrophota bacterium]
MGENERMKWWEEARFGMFIHWGLYSLLGRGEWVLLVERIPLKEYAKLADRFNPPKSFSPEKWVKLAKEAGMKYMILTTRHHDGFCLFNSKVSDFTSVKTAAKRDFVEEYVNACRKHNIRIGFYYSLLDWRFPGYFDREKYPESFEQIVQQAHSQVRELMTNYGKIDYLFYDGEWIPGVPCGRGFRESGESPEVAKLWRAKELNAMVRKLQPDIILNNRSGIPEDVDTPEMFVVSSKEGRMWETCMTMGDFGIWGYAKHNNMKPVIQLIQDLVSCASNRGNYALNIGPKPDGSVRAEEVYRLKEIGKWLKKNGEAIYGTERTPNGFGFWGAGMLGMATVKGTHAYLHIFRWPGETAVITGIKNKVLSARILGYKRKLKIIKEDGRLIIKGLPVKPPDKYGTVIALDLDGKPETFDYSRISLI